MRLDEKLMVVRPPLQGGVEPAEGGSITLIQSIISASQPRCLLLIIFISQFPKGTVEKSPSGPMVAHEIALPTHQAITKASLS